MRENRTYGSEGGGTDFSVLPTPIVAITLCVMSRSLHRLPFPITGHGPRNMSAPNPGSDLNLFDPSVTGVDKFSHGVRVFPTCKCVGLRPMNGDDCH
jgi:hypothetical protein